jgi:hypothetical protein
MLYVKARYGQVLFKDETRFVYRQGTIVQGDMYKLMTLIPLELQVANADSGRLILGPIGRLIRRFSLDEVPQLLLVATGRWALFGPRAIPNTPGRILADGRTPLDLVDTPIRYRRADGSYRKPGAFSTKVAVTERGRVRSPTMATMLLYDRYDAEHGSPGLALRIVFRTVLTMLWGEGGEEFRGAVPVQTVAPAPRAEPVHRPFLTRLAIAAGLLTLLGAGIAGGLKLIRRLRQGRSAGSSDRAQFGVMALGLLEGMGNWGTGTVTHPAAIVLLGMAVSLVVLFWWWRHLPPRQEEGDSGQDLNKEEDYGVWSYRTIASQG